MYIDDNFIQVSKFYGKSLQQALDWTIEQVEEYMAKNKLHLNKDKTQLGKFKKTKQKNIWMDLVQLT